MREDDIARGLGPAVTLTHGVDEDSPLGSLMVHELLRRGHRLLGACWRLGGNAARCGFPDRLSCHRGTASWGSTEGGTR
jgi:hypothetical protein